jgi:hypothetical protein
VVDFILGFLLIWMFVMLFGILMWVVYDIFCNEILENVENKKRLTIFLKITISVSLVIVFIIKVWG